MKFKNVFVVPQVSREKQQLLKMHLLKENMQRCKLFAQIVILFEAILICMNISSSYEENHGHFVITIYFVLYFILMLMSFFMLVYINRMEKKETYTERFYNRIQLGLLSFVCFFLVWGAAVTLVDQKEYGHVMAFAVNFMCVSVLFHASNRTILLLYIAPITVLLFGLPIFQPSSAILMGHYINLTVFLFFCWLASRMLYTSYASNFFNKLLLTESNERLALKMEENEKINKELAKANKQLKKMTIIDELTQIPNRRGFQKYIRDTLIGANKKRKLTLMMIDIDAFKLFNDHYGHLEGDKILKSVAQKIQASIHFFDGISARFGGEEFVAAVFDLDVKAVEQLAESIRKAVFKMEIPHEYSPFSDRVTISIGITTGNVSKAENMEKLMKDADSALYESKSKGRNRVEYFSGTTSVGVKSKVD
ncbi:GGDEF domain-containing protein [Niallia nealsonii]|nr:GGDEF domain-containing protein [Niallia nealsonii]